MSPPPTHTAGSLAVLTFGMLMSISRIDSNDSGALDLSVCRTSSHCQWSRVYSADIKGEIMERDMRHDTNPHFSTLLFANNTALNRVAAFCDLGIMRGDVGVYSAHYKVSL